MVVCQERSNNLSNINRNRVHRVSYMILKTCYIRHVYFMQIIFLKESKLIIERAVQVDLLNNLLHIKYV